MSAAMRWIERGCGGLALALVVTGCGAMSGRTGMEDALSALIAADNAGDVQAIVSCYAPDAVLLPPAGPAIRGRKAIDAQYRDGLSQFRLEVSLSIDESAEAETWGFARGTTRGRYVWHDGSPPTHLHDKYLAILKRGEGGRWVVATLMWSPVEGDDAGAGTESAAKP